MARKQLERTPAPLARGQLVQVAEVNIRPWRAVVRGQKWSSVSGWWIDVEREDDKLTYSMRAALVQPIVDGAAPQQLRLEGGE
jgi:hypothetical protein